MVTKSKISMSSNTTSVECPECGEQFDPSIMGGWCTNDGCGEYRWEPDEETTSDDSNINESDSDVDTTSSEDATIESSTGVDSSNQSKISCPECNDVVPNKSYCRECGADLSAVDSEDSGYETDTDNIGSAEASDNGISDTRKEGLDNTGVEASDTESEDVQAQSNEEHLNEDTEPTLDACPTCGEDIEDEWKTCPFCETNLKNIRQPDHGTESDGKPPERVVVKVKKEKIEVADGSSIGSEVRAAYVDAGGNNDEAQWISREHVRFEREGEEFFIIHKGTNATHLNGNELDGDERRVVSEGDTIDFAGVTTGTVQFE